MILSRYFIRSAIRIVISRDTALPAMSGAPTMPPGRRAGRSRGTQAGGPRGSRAAASTTRRPTKELGVARSSDAASMCPGVPPSRGTQSVGPPVVRRRRRPPRVAALTIMYTRGLAKAR